MKPQIDIADFVEGEWHALPVPQQISDLINYWGTEEIMGSAYQIGWQIDFEA